MNMTGCKKALTSLKQWNSQHTCKNFRSDQNSLNCIFERWYFMICKNCKFNFTLRNRNVALVRTATNPTINNETMRNDTVSFCVGALMTVTLSTSRIRIFCLRKDHLAVLVNSSASDVDP
ncbi:hypothetical protein T02_15041 [Trichinella nativa]|uniref:Uncharacterized protein n=1 Tax=Trichinella nativa TaxID=6335 RepID=A0A0V1KSN3_9BILA|nr:hypothetical protein T02_15041 [Trichinella nativa]